MWLRSFLLCFAVLLAGCGEISVPMAGTASDMEGKRFDAPAAGTASLYVIFTDDYQINISVGQRTLGGLSNQTWFRVDLPPGQHDVRAIGQDGSTSFVVDLAPGQMRYLTVRYQHMRLIGIITEVQPAEGQRLVRAGRRAQEIR